MKDYNEGKLYGGIALIVVGIAISVDAKITGITPAASPSIISITFLLTFLKNTTVAEPSIVKNHVINAAIKAKITGLHKKILWGINHTPIIFYVKNNLE